MLKKSEIFKVSNDSKISWQFFVTKKELILFWTVSMTMNILKFITLLSYLYLTDTSRLWSKQ